MVSLPCWEWFEAQNEGYRAEVLPPGVPALSVEAGSTFGWSRYADASVGLDRFGASAPGAVALERLGFTVDHVAERAQALAGQRKQGAFDMTRLQDLYDIAGQSPWLDNLRRDWLDNGQLAELVSNGVRGITSNPTIFANAISGQDTYDAQFKQLIADHTVESAYWELAITDIQSGLELLRPLYEESNGEDGFVSLEVSPGLAHDTEGTVRDARMLHTRIAQPNLLVKVPATKEGVPAINALLSEGRSINVTLIFGLDRYDEVIEAYISGLEALAAAGRAAEFPRVASVASFFVSRVDTEVDRRLESLAGGESGDAAILALRGTAAVAQAQVAYQHFHAAFSTDRWKALAAQGARVQRPLWASTSTKNPAYPDLLYVDNLIGPATVNTMPEGTLEAFQSHGTVARTVDAHPGRRRRAGPPGRRGHRHGGRRADAGGRGGPLVRQVLRRVAAVAERQGVHSHVTVRLRRAGGLHRRGRRGVRVPSGPTLHPRAVGGTDGAGVL